ncbi:cytosolic cu zn superoxide dismutase [Grosmannia clavigera kw1407]|uniref:superoxide dismutase n=1 Tax=Grosmannia clavigera (strain kw1407 / UAMH 11150) TaxID=655863 RepID=F0X936_GROCL|nr:cytosolic cu zn superoxide dismutase [Grosmannia clavigera kw1407]EFX06134.1 cytosolic cu zn superoxide dismutase [Grosmannia clavigera kw1407]
MRASILLSAIFIAIAAARVAISEDGPITGALGSATVTADNPPGQVYIATLPKTAFDKAAYPSGGNVEGRISAEAHPGGIGVDFDINFWNLPETDGPFTYHIHEFPVPIDGNCIATGGHLDPFRREDDPACDSKLKQTCEVGDLSGKHSKITSDPFIATYRDLYTSTKPGNPAFFGNLSFVLHYSNKTRITCANFILQNASYTSTDNGTATATPYPSSSSVSPKVPMPSGTASGAASSFPKAAIVGVGVAAVLEAAMILFM